MRKRHGWFVPLSLVAAACGGYGADATPSDSASDAIVSGKDTKPPSTPQPIADETRTSVVLSWPASTDNVGVVGYDVWLDGVLVATSPATSFAKNDAVCATTYAFAVDAFDAAGNHSAQAQVSVTTPPCLDDWKDVYDFFVQDVCLDAGGTVVMGVAPTDGDPRCVTHRDLRSGESLPWHKVDTDSGKVSDEIPVATGAQNAGLIAMRAKGGKGGPLTIGDGPGNIYLRSAKTFSSTMSLDPNGPFFHIGSNCSGGVPELASLYDTKVRVDVDALAKSSGSASTYGIGFAKVLSPSTTCPDSYPHGEVNEWFFATYPYQRLDGTMTPPLQTLVSTDTDPADDKDHIEVYYQTREIGRTRYEAFQNVAGHDQDYKDRFYALHDKLVKSGVCNPLALAPPPQTPGGEWVEFGCSVYLATGAPNDARHGDSPQVWIDIAQASNMMATIFGTAPTDDPKILSITPSSLPWGSTDPITIQGSGFGNAWFGSTVDVMFNGGAIHVVTESQDRGSRIVFSISQDEWDGSRKLHELNCGNKAGNAVHVYDGVSVSNPVRFDVTDCPP